jgi:hypothetical protein
MNLLPSFVNKNYFKVLRCSQLSNNFSDDLSFHNHIRLKKIQKGKHTYDGKYNCGVTSFILGNILKEKNLPIKMYLYETGYGKYKEDHVFLKVNDLIIDPTYKQFFNDNRKHGFSNYNNYLYEELSPFFVGTQKELQSMFNTLKSKNLDEFSISEIDDNVLDNWKSKEDITTKLNDFHKIFNKDYVKRLIYI